MILSDKTTPKILPTMRKDFLGGCGIIQLDLAHAKRHVKVSILKESDLHVLTFLEISWKQNTFKNPKAIIKRRL